MVLYIEFMSTGLEHVIITNIGAMSKGLGHNIICGYTDLNLNKTKYDVQGLVTLWIVNRHNKFKVRYPEHGYHVNFPALFKPY